MAPKMRERVILISVNFGLTAILMLSLYFLGLKDANARSLKKDIEKKLDKTEYTKDQKEKWDSHNDIHALETKAFDNVVLKIDWLYQNEINKGNNSIRPLNINNE